MKKLIQLSLLAALASSMMACTSYVRTFDGNGALLGECAMHRALFLPAGAMTCHGSANPKDQK